MPGGRPKKEFKAWDGWKEEILSLYGEGASDIEIRALVADKMEDTESCSWDLWHRWLEEEPEFSEAIKKGRLLCEAWWEGKGRKSLNDNTFSATLWYMNMKNRFGWKDKTEVESSGGVNVNIVRYSDAKEEKE